MSDDERRETPMSITEAVSTGDVLEMLMAQRRLVAESLETAAENTKPQFNNELNKLHNLIRDEQERRAALEDVDEDEVVVVNDRFDPKAI